MKGRVMNLFSPDNQFINKAPCYTMQMADNREVIFEGCRGVVEYTNESVKLNTGSTIVAFSGRGLYIRKMTDSDIIIGGFILSVEFIM